MFNMEIEWRKMWNLEDSITRTNTNHKLFILLEDNQPLGHVWFNDGFLYKHLFHVKEKMVIQYGLLKKVFLK